MSSVTNKLSRYAEDDHVGDSIMQVIIYDWKRFAFPRHGQ